MEEQSSSPGSVVPQMMVCRVYYDTPVLMPQYFPAAPSSSPLQSSGHSSPNQMQQMIFRPQKPMPWNNQIPTFVLPQQVSMPQYVMPPNQQIPYQLPMMLPQQIVHPQMLPTPSMSINPHNLQPQFTNQHLSQMETSVATNSGQNIIQNAYQQAINLNSTNQIKLQTRPAVEPPRNVCRPMMKPRPRLPSANQDNAPNAARLPVVRPNFRNPSEKFAPKVLRYPTSSGQPYSGYAVRPTAPQIVVTERPLNSSRTSEIHLVPCTTTQIQRNTERRNQFTNTESACNTNDNTVTSNNLGIKENVPNKTVTVENVADTSNRLEKCSQNVNLTDKEKAVNSKQPTPPPLLAIANITSNPTEVGMKTEPNLTSDAKTYTNKQKAWTQTLKAVNLSNQNPSQQDAIKKSESVDDSDSRQKGEELKNDGNKTDISIIKTTPNVSNDMIVDFSIKSETVTDSTDINIRKRKHVNTPDSFENVEEELTNELNIKREKSIETVIGNKLTPDTIRQSSEDSKIIKNEFNATQTRSMPILTDDLITPNPINNPVETQIKSEKVETISVEVKKEESFKKKSIPIETQLHAKELNFQHDSYGNVSILEKNYKTVNSSSKYKLAHGNIWIDEDDHYKDYIFTHILDGFVIQESDQPFPIRHPLREKFPPNGIVEEKACINPDNPFSSLQPDTVKSWKTKQLIQHLIKHEWSDSAKIIEKEEIDGESLFLCTTTQLTLVGLDEEQANIITTFTGMQNTEDAL